MFTSADLQFGLQGRNVSCYKVVGSGCYDNLPCTHCIWTMYMYWHMFIVCQSKVLGWMMEPLSPKHTYLPRPKHACVVMAMACYV